MNTTEREANCTPSDLRRRLQAGECQLVDVREHGEWAGGRVAGAHHIPLGELAARCHGELPGDAPIVVMCQSGGRSKKGATILREHGFEDVTELGGGMGAWAGAGLELERDARAPWPLDRQVRLAAGLLVLLGLGVSLVWPWAIVLSWFVGGGLVFASLTDWCGMGMLLAKAPWNRPRSAPSRG